MALRYLTVLVAATVAASPPASRAATLLVDPAGGADFADIQSALDAASDGDEVRVLPGEYVIARPLDFNRLHDPEDPQSPPPRDLTLASRDGPERTTIRMSPAPDSPTAASVIVFLSRESSRSTLRGFTVRGGRGSASAQGGWAAGGGIFLGADASPAIQECRIEGNSAEVGGGVYCGPGAGPAIERCTIAGNAAERGGGAFADVGSAPRIVECSISGNSGDGVAVVEAFVSLEGTQLVQNAPAGLSAGPGSDAEATGCELRRNETGIACSECERLSVASSRIRASSRDGIRCEAARWTLYDTVVHANSGAGIVSATEEFCTIANCTISGNAGAGIQAEGETPLYLIDTIVWANGGGSIAGSASADVEVGFSCVEGQAPPPGPGNLSTDPLFCGWEGRRELWVDDDADPGGDGTQARPYRDFGWTVDDFSFDLAVGSPCLDAASGEGKPHVGAGSPCEAPPGGPILARVRPGSYALPSHALLEEVSVRGEGPSTRLAGSGIALRSATSIAEATVVGDLLVPERQAPEVSRCVVAFGSGDGILCREGSAPRIEHSEIRRHAGHGIRALAGATPDIARCTIVENGGAGIACEDSGPILASSIVWHNLGGSVSAGGPAGPRFDHSSVEGDAPPPGDGNISSPPIFCGWGQRSEGWVAPADPPGGSGTQADPWRGVASALEAYSLALSPGSPCRGSGRDGVDMGAAGRCEETGRWGLELRLEPGAHALEQFALLHGMSVAGSGAESTSFRGTVVGPWTGASISDLTLQGGLRVPGEESPEVVRTKVVGATGFGVECGEGSSPSLVDCGVEGNLGGGVLCSRRSSPTFDRCRISGNLSGNGSTLGGGLSCDEESAPSLVDCAIERNSIEVECDETRPSCDGPLLGGGVHCAARSSPSFLNCVIAENSVRLSGSCEDECRVGGGGLHVGEGSTPRLVNCLIAANFADEGGALLGDAGAAPMLLNCTITANLRGAIVGAPGFLGALENCIVWNNSPDSVCCRVESCIVDDDPLFVAPDVGDYHLLPDSPAVDRGAFGAAPAFDLEGTARPCGAGIDVGAYERGGCPPATSFRRGDTDSSGTLSLTDPIVALRYLFLGGETPTCLASADADDDGLVNLADPIFTLNHLFLGGPPIAPPFPECGRDPVADSLGCGGFDACP